MGCKCGKRPEEISVNLQNQTENRTNGLNNVTNIPNRKDCITMSQNKESSANFDISNRQDSQPQLKQTTIDQNPFSPKCEFGENNMQNKESTNLGFDNVENDNRIQKSSMEKPLMDGKKDYNNLGNSSNVNQQIDYQYNSISFDDAILDLLNQVRQNPKCFIGELSKGAKKITTKNDRLVYVGAVKVQLSRGKEVFEEAIQYLNRLEPMKPLERNSQIQIESPKTINQIKEKKYLKEEVLKNYSGVVDYYFKDHVTDPTTLLILALAGANEILENKKRNAFLNPNYKYIGITSALIDKTFCAYFTFA